jgi:hypothetical protein
LVALLLRHDGTLRGDDRELATGRGDVLVILDAEGQVLHSMPFPEVPGGTRNTVLAVGDMEVLVGGRLLRRRPEDRGEPAIIQGVPTVAGHLRYSIFDPRESSVTVAAASAGPRAAVWAYTLDPDPARRGGDPFLVTMSYAVSEMDAPSGGRMLFGGDQPIRDLQVDGTVADGQLLAGSYAGHFGASGRAAPVTDDRSTFIAATVEGRLAWLAAVTPDARGHQRVPVALRGTPRGAWLITAEAPMHAPFTAPATAAAQTLVLHAFDGSGVEQSRCTLHEAMRPAGLIDASLGETEVGIITRDGEHTKFASYDLRCRPALLAESTPLDLRAVRRVGPGYFVVISDGRSVLAGVTH